MSKQLKSKKIKAKNKKGPNKNKIANKKNNNNSEINTSKKNPKTPISHNSKNIPNKPINNDNIKKTNQQEPSLSPSTKTITDEQKKSFLIDNYLLNVIFITLITFSIELIFKKINEFSLLSYSSLRILLSNLMLSIIVTFISSSARHRPIRNIINITYVFAYSVYSWLQLGFMNFLGVYISFNTSSQAGAVMDYLSDFLSSFRPIFYIIYIPFIITILFYIFIHKLKYQKIKYNFKILLIIPILTILTYSYYLTLTLPFMQSDFQVKNTLKLFLNPDVPSVAINQLGASIFSLTDLRTYLYPVENNFTYDLSFQENQEEITTTRQVSPLLNELARKETNSQYATLNKYFAAQEVTDYNDYTGMFEGMNVVVVLLESGSYAQINEKYYPHLYKLYNEGWYWDNYYSPRNSCATGNNEFSALTGLYSIYNTCTTNTYKDNTYFESIFGIFNNAGYRTTSMHNFTEWYYYRKTSHKNMGSTYYGADLLDIKTSTYGEWPSDIELMQKAFPIILDNEDERPWFTWLTTVTAHQPYSKSSTYGDLYLDYFRKEGYTTTTARYMSKLKTVDEAIGYMIKTLEEQKALDNTLIIMMPDHYPYGLKKEQILEMYHTEYNDYEKEKVPLIMYNPQMESTIYHSYTSYVNLLPTIANLLNIEYDSRLYMGTDLFSENYESLVIFADGSWKNENAFYDASTGKITEYKEGYYTKEELKEITNKATTQTTISTLAIKNNYFAYLKEKQDAYDLLNNNDNNNEISTIASNDNDN